MAAKTTKAIHQPLKSSKVILDVRYEGGSSLKYEMKSGAGVMNVKSSTEVPVEEALLRAIEECSFLLGMSGFAEQADARFTKGYGRYLKVISDGISKT